MGKRFLLFALIGMVAMNVAKAQSETGVIINGVKWATCNVDMPGTFTAKPEDAGMFYQWNRSIGWSTTDPLINSEGGTTWDETIPTGDNWETSNDPCPVGWRVPTTEETTSLVAAGSFWGEYNGVTGRFFGSSEPYMFLPAAGNRNNSTGILRNVGEEGYYWSSSGDNPNNAYTLYFGDGDDIEPAWSYRRHFGYCVRCVSEENVGIKDNEFDNSLIYSHFNNIHIKNVSQTAQAVEIYDITGRLVHQSSITETETVITLDVLSGIYIVKIISEKGVISVNKVSIIKE